MLWPLMKWLARVTRGECFVTSFSTLDIEEEDLTPEHFAVLRSDLRFRLIHERSRRILAVGPLSAKALLGDRFTDMHTCSGMGFEIAAPVGPVVVIPAWHPRTALAGETPNSGLVMTAAAIKEMEPGREVKLCPAVPVEAPMSRVWTPGEGDTHFWGTTAAFGIDTEGTPDDPICMTLASAAGPRWYVAAEHVPAFFADGPACAMRFVFHNALWDWPVLRAMGAPALATRWRWADTMELAYLRQTEPKGLKELAYRHLGIRMRTFNDVVLPHWRSMVQATAEGRIAAGTTTVTHSPKTGKLLKKPKVTLTDEVKPLKRALANVDLLATRMPGLPAPTLRLVPEAERVEYATLDAWATVMLEEHLR